MGQRQLSYSSGLAMRVKYYSPSYKRPQKSSTQKKYPDVILVVAESEAEDYRANGNEVITVPDAVQGNISRVKNWMLDNLFEDADCLIFMDDDASSVACFQNQQRHTFEMQELTEACKQWAILCQQWGFHYWGLNCVPDKQSYRESNPFTTLQFIGGPFQAFLKTNTLRYDEALPLKEDYDMTLQQIHKHGGCLRINYAHFWVKQAEQAGGCAAYRSLDRERQQFFALQRKWGKDVITRDKKSKRSFDFNPKMRVPIKGV